jgi:hypothetical protein
MAYVRGAAVRDLERLFLERWQVAVGERLEPVPDSEATFEFDDAIPVPAREVGLCRTVRFANEQISEVLQLHRRAILQAERLIYLETQYFTAGAVRDVLVERMRRSPVSVVLVMPVGADTPKERLVLGAAQERLLQSLALEAERLGSRFRLFSSTPSGPAPQRSATFIHSKVLVVDDRVLAIGSANLTNRSLLLDSELTLAFEEVERRDGDVARAIARTRAELLGEHSGVVPDLEFFACDDGLVQRLDTLVASGNSRLAPRQIDRELAESSPVLNLEQLFDPAKPLTELELTELVGVDFDDWSSARHSATATTRQTTTSIPTPTQSNR